MGALPLLPLLRRLPFSGHSSGGVIGGVAGAGAAAVAEMP
jgi:hypothetical protein